MASSAAGSSRNPPAAALRGKKRPGSPAGCGPQQPNRDKKKKGLPVPTPAGPPTQVAAADTEPEVKVLGSVDSCPPITESRPPPFKDPTFMHSGIGGAAAGKKNRTWKNLKQILALERALPWKLSDPSYYNIDAPPSLKPAKKYSDISGLPASYTDPQTKLRFTSTEEFSYIRLLPSDVVSGYLTLRKATCIVP